MPLEEVKWALISLVGIYSTRLLAAMTSGLLIAIRSARGARARVSAVSYGPFVLCMLGTEQTS